MGVRMLTADNLVDFARDDVDVGVRIGREASWPDVEAELLFRIDFTPMCSPEFLDRHGGTIAPADILRLPQISPHDVWWSVWLREAGVEVPEGNIRPGVRLDSQANEGAAAMAGQGIALLTPFFWRNDMAERRLIRPFPQISTRNYGYWLVYPGYRRQVHKIRRFREWLLAEVKRDLDWLSQNRMTNPVAM
jgi:LysR family glycine cleavage system transcriptional activator